MWKAPDRPDNRISQTFNDGIVNIFREVNAAPPGRLPDIQLTPVVSLKYEERRLGIQRYYDAKQNQIHAERVIRVPHQRAALVSTQDTAITEDRRQYRIDLIQFVPDVYPPSDDLTLVQYTQGVSGP